MDVHFFWNIILQYLVLMIYLPQPYTKAYALFSRPSVSLWYIRLVPIDSTLRTIYAFVPKTEITGQRIINYITQNSNGVDIFFYSIFAPGKCVIIFFSDFLPHLGGVSELHL